MKVTKIDENDLSNISYLKGEHLSFYKSIGHFESQISNNSKIDSGYYKINRNIFMSIWKYKKIHGGINTNNVNYNDAIKMIRSGRISEKIIVHTHSSFFPTVNGYLRDELKKFYS